MKENLLITGGNGFVGTNTVQAFQRENSYNVFAPSRKELDLKNYNQVFEYLQNNNINCVIHTAGKVGGIIPNQKYPVDFFRENVLIGMNILEASKKAKIKKLINLSSSCVYPRDMPILKEEDLLSGFLEPTNEGYALAKISVSKLCQWIGEENNYFWKTLFPCNLYGPYDHFDLENSHVLPAIINKVDDAKEKNKKEIIIWGDGQAKREFLYVKDLTKALVYLLQNIERLPAYLNIGSGVDYTINEYYQKVAEVIGWSGNFVHDLTKPVGMRKKLLDVSLLKEAGFTANTPLNTGIEETYHWYINNKKKALS